MGRSLEASLHRKNLGGVKIPPLTITIKFVIMIIENKKGIDTMTNKELFKLWEEFRAEQFNCYPDENGNYPCDNGELCDQCCTCEAIRRFSNWKRQKENQPIGYRIHVKDIVTYEFGINYTREKAVEQALEWFADREPCVEVEELR